MNLNSLHTQLNGEMGQVAPVDDWDPPFCGDMNLVIKHDGSWHYQGTPIGRQKLVNLFASVLKREQDDYFLVTPVEKVGIQVEDRPFVITQWKQQDSILTFSTQTQNSFIVGKTHPVVLKQDKTTDDILPYVCVRKNLWARLHQNVYYQLIEIGQVKSWSNESHLIVASGDYEFSMGSVS